LVVLGRLGGALGLLAEGWARADGLLAAPESSQVGSAEGQSKTSGWEVV
jgi:hypothetical protein